VVASTPAHLTELAGYTGDVEVHLDRTMCEALAGRDIPANWILHVPGRPTAELSAVLDPDWRAFFGALPPGYRAQNLPACLMPGARIERPLRVLDTAVQHADGRLAIDPLVSRFAQHAYRSKSVRCRACPADEVCEGTFVQSIRAHGYRQLQPLEGPGTSDTVRRLTSLATPAPRLRDGASPQPPAPRCPVSGNTPVPFIDEAPGRRS
jgi:hypothetical protein